MTICRKEDTHSKVIVWLFSSDASEALRLATCFGWGRRPLKNYESHIDASLSRQPLVKGERLVRYEVNAVIIN